MNVNDIIKIAIAVFTMILIGGYFLINGTIEESVLTSVGSIVTLLIGLFTRLETGESDA